MSSVQTLDTALLRVTDLNYSVAGRELLRRISFSLQSGQLLVVLGRNGAGKSTLLKHISGDLHGQGVELFDLKLEGHSAKKLAQQRATLPQSTPIAFAYEVLDVVLLGRIPHGTRETDEDRRVARDCLARVGLQGYETRNIQTLSGGEQQRVHLARTLAQLHGPATQKVLLLDEPTASLDLAHQHSTLRLARELCAEGVGVLAVLHDLNLAAQYADQILMLSDGEILTCDTPHAALTCERIHAAYGHEVLVTQHPCLNCPLIVSAS